MCVQRTPRRVRERFHRFTPGGLLQGYRAVTVRERLRNHGATARQCGK